MENGLKVGIIGFTTDFINRWERPENIKDIDMDKSLNIELSDGTVETKIVQIKEK